MTTRITKTWFDGGKVVTKEIPESEAYKQEHDAYGYAKRLAEAIWQKHYKATAPQWKPLDDLMGVLTQIDNMTAGLTTPPAAQTAPAQKPLAWADEIIADLHALYDSEMITENDSGDALIRLDAAICAVEEAEERHTTPPAHSAQRQPLTDEAIWRQYQALWPFHPAEEPRLAADMVTFARAIEAAHGIGEKT